MNIGFTGTQNGMTDRQKGGVRRALAVHWKLPATFHEGDCVGADVEAAEIAFEAAWKIVVHPPVDGKKRAFYAPPNSMVLPKKPYLERNRDIVDACDLLLAAPQWVEKRRSGTWATIRYADSIGRPIVIFYPNGDIEWRNQ